MGPRPQLQSNRNHLASTSLLLRRQKAPVGNPPPRFPQRARPAPESGQAVPERPRPLAAPAWEPHSGRRASTRPAALGPGAAAAPPTPPRPCLTSPGLPQGRLPPTPPGGEDPPFPRPAPPGGSFSSARAGGAVPPPPPPGPPHPNGGARNSRPAAASPLPASAAAPRRQQQVCNPPPPPSSSLPACASVAGEQRG